ncbi:MAG TPA: NAD(P)H-hydrate dehydratase [Solirubrobacteraceae bacterium]|nr:NAD(P)H-hydrate dehydratase [Solirubrobacteraceae bacterium]
MTLPGWATPLPDAAGQRELDRWAIERLGIAGLELMERAGTGLADCVQSIAPSAPVAVVCGKGNNGGDGFVAARVLRERGWEVSVLLLGEPEEYRGDALTNLERLPGDAPEPFSADALRSASLIIDALLGTGFSGEVRERYAAAIEAINDTRARVVACDVPSGVDASTGEVAGPAVRAELTVTFHAAKPGLWIAPGKAHAGEVRVIDIGIPSGGPVQPDVGLIVAEVTDGVPRRGSDSTKFAAGSVLVCGGSPGLTGAVCLAAESAMRAGAGYVTALVPGALSQIFENRLLEVMTLALHDDSGHLTPAALDAIRDRAERADALVLGPGLGREPDTLEFARRLATSLRKPLVIDADGLNAHAKSLDRLARRTAPTVLTPHAGELGRLLERPSSEIAAHRLATVRDAARRAGAVVVLKGDDTLVAEPSGTVAVSQGGAPALATAGTGDVLSGVIGAYLAKGMDPFRAAAAGVFVHAAAGRLAGSEIGSEGVIASDVIARLPHALPPLQRPRAG